MAALKRATLLELPTLIPRVFSRQARIVQRHRQVEGFPGLSEARVESVGEKSFPLQVDGDYIGEFDEVVYRTLPGAWSRSPDGARLDAGAAAASRPPTGWARFPRAARGMAVA